MWVCCVYVCVVYVMNVSESEENVISSESPNVIEHLLGQMVYYGKVKMNIIMMIRDMVFMKQTNLVVDGV